MIRILDRLVPEPGSIYGLDREYVDFERLYRLHQTLATFVIRGKQNLPLLHPFSHPVDHTTGPICDQTVLHSLRRTTCLIPQAYVDRPHLQRRNLALLSPQHIGVSRVKWIPPSEDV